MKLLKIISILAIILPATATATQIKLAVDNSEIIGKISVLDVNRISLVNDRIRSVKTNKLGYEFINDDASGDVYIRTLPGNVGDPLNAFIASEKGYTYKLLLTPIDIPSEQIFIKNLAILKEKSQKHDLEPLAYKQELIDLVKAMGNSQVNSAYQIKSVRIPYITNNKQLKMTKKVIYKGSQYEGSIYKLKNIGSQDMALTEPFFTRKGIRAIKLDKLLLAPQETTYVYMVGESRS